MRAVAAEDRLLLARVAAWAWRQFGVLPSLPLDGRPLRAAQAARTGAGGGATPARLLVASAVPPVLGLVINPYFPHSLGVAWDQIVHVALAVWWKSAAIPPQLYGSELLATRTDLFLGSWPAFLPALVGVAAFLAYPQHRLSTEGLALVLVAAVLLAVGFLSERFLSFFFPVGVLLGARLWSELLGTEPLGELARMRARTFVAWAALVAGCLVAGSADGSVVSLRRQARAMPTAELLRPAVEFLTREARPDELVYHNFWWDFSVLYHYRPQGRYVVALDPVFMYRHDPARFRLALEAFEGRSADLYRVLRHEFDARWVFVPKAPRYRPFFDLLRRDGRFEKAYEDEQAVIARLRVE